MFLVTFGFRTARLFLILLNQSFEYLPVNHLILVFDFLFNFAVNCLELGELALKLAVLETRIGIQ